MSIKGQDHSLTFAKDHSDSKLKLVFFSEIVRSFETKFYVKAYGRIGMKLYLKRVGSHDQNGHHAHIW